MAMRAKSIEIPLSGKKCRVISIADLIEVKKSMKRPKDIQIAQELKLIQEKLNKLS